MIAAAMSLILNAVIAARAATKMLFRVLCVALQESQLCLFPQ
jgi:hypothetical protein